MEFHLVDYKGKYFVIQDELYEQDFFTCGKITKEKALEKDFIKRHKANCRYYGIPPIITKDKDLLEAYKD